MKQCLIVLLSYLLITQQSRSNYLVSYEKLYELPNLLSEYLCIQMDDNRLGATGPAGMLSVLSLPGEQQHPQRAARMGSSHGGPCPHDEKPSVFQRLGNRLKSPVPHRFRSEHDLFWAHSPLSSAPQFQFYQFPTYSTYIYSFLTLFRHTAGIAEECTQRSLFSVAMPYAKAEVPWAWATRKKI